MVSSNRIDYCHSRALSHQFGKTLLSEVTFIAIFYWTPVDFFWLKINFKELICVVTCISAKRHNGKASSIRLMELTRFSLGVFALWADLLALWAYKEGHPPEVFQNYEKRIYSAILSVAVYSSLAESLTSQLCSPCPKTLPCRLTQI